MANTTTATKQFDWLWHTATITCLIISGTFITNTLHAFSQDGFDLLQTFGAISQGAGLLLITGGTLTDKGKQVIQDILTTLKIPVRYQAEGTFAIAFAVLTITYIINASLPLLGEYYYQRGQHFYQHSQLSKAEENFKQGLNFTQSNAKISVALGNVYETLGEHSKAEPLYKLGASSGHPESLNGLGRVQMRTASGYEDLLLAETSFRLALTQTRLDPSLKSEILSHLGITLIKQAEVNKEAATALRQVAKQVLTRGIALDKTLSDRVPGLGLSHCYLAILAKKNSPQQWQPCINHALPTSIDQFRDILLYAGPGIAEKINTTGIVIHQQDG